VDSTYLATCVKYHSHWQQRQIYHWHLGDAPNPGDQVFYDVES